MEIIESAAQRVGISQSGLDVNKMHQDKFQQAANCMDKESQDATTPHNSPEKSLTRSASKSAEYPATPRSQSKLARTKHRFGSVGYWKFLYEQSQNVIQESYEKSMKIDEIPGLLTYRKVKPKEILKTNTRITNVHGSMEAQDFLKKVEVIEEEKTKKEQGKIENQARKESFYRCKTKCACKEDQCAAKNLKRMSQVSFYNGLSMWSSCLSYQWYQTSYDFTCCINTNSQTH